MKKRVLIVEDNVVAAKIEKAIMSNLDCEVDSVFSGEEGVAISSKNKYDLILMDLGLPGINGLQATEKIRAANSDINNHSTPIVAITANENPDEYAKCVKAGINDVVCKPLNPNKAKKIISGFWHSAGAA